MYLVVYCIHKYTSGEKICTYYPSVRTIEVQSTYNADIRNQHKFPVIISVT